MDRPSRVTTSLLINFSELAATETENVSSMTKFLGSSFLLVEDLEKLYIALFKRVKLPSGSEADEEILTGEVVFNQCAMCRMLMSKSILNVLRLYRADALIHLRRAIETCAYALYMTKHKHLADIWSRAGSGDVKDYKKYRDEFSVGKVFPKAKDNSTLSILKERMDVCSKTIHGSVFGAAGHLATVRRENRPGLKVVNFSDINREDDLKKAFFFVLHTHMLVLEICELTLRSYLAASASTWDSEYKPIMERLMRHVEKASGKIVL